MDAIPCVFFCFVTGCHAEYLSVYVVPSADPSAFILLIVLLKSLSEEHVLALLPSAGAV